jgi:hypothetical protein
VVLFAGYGVALAFFNYIRPNVQDRLLANKEYIFIIPIVIVCSCTPGTLSLSRGLSRYTISFNLGIGTGYVLSKDFSRTLSTDQGTFLQLWGTGDWWKTVRTAFTSWCCQQPSVLPVHPAEEGRPGQDLYGRPRGHDGGVRRCLRKHGYGSCVPVPRTYAVPSGRLAAPNKVANLLGKDISGGGVFPPPLLVDVGLLRARILLQALAPPQA